MDQMLNNDISNIKFTPLTVSGENCNVNRQEHELVLLNDFGNAIPYYNKEDGLHLRVISKKTGKPIIVPLDVSVTYGLMIDNAKGMTEEEYYTEFTRVKTEFLAEYLIKNTYAKGYEVPAAVQAITGIELLQGKDSLVQFKSGKGKTHAFLFGCLWGFDHRDETLQYIFITSSHEVATQIFQQAKHLVGAIASVALCVGQKQASSTTSSGGFKTPISTSSLNTRQKSAKEEMEEITRAQILICTMGKFYDLYCNKRKINTQYLKTICIDEFDNIIASNPRSKSRSAASCLMSTEEQMAAIIKKIPERTQRIFFSATVSEEALMIAHNYFRGPEESYNKDPLIVLLDVVDCTIDDIKQYYVPCTNFAEKKEVLVDLIKQCRISQAIIYANSINTANEIKYLLDQLAVPIQSAVFHGSLSEVERRKIYNDFVAGITRMLISTDVTARGLDVQGVNVVFNFDMPDVLETYIHRVGRSGRYNRKGVAISLVLVNDAKNEQQKVREINECSKIKMTELPEDLSTLL